MANSTRRQKPNTGFALLMYIREFVLSLLLMSLITCPSGDSDSPSKGVATCERGWAHGGKEEDAIEKLETGACCVPQRGHHLQLQIGDQ